MKYILTVILILQSVILYNYDQYYEKYSPLVNKYLPLEEALQKVQKGTWEEGHMCEQFSQELVEELSQKGIQASVIYGESPKTKEQEDINHAWTCVWLEPQTGEFTSNYSN